MEKKGFSVFDFLERIQNEAVFATSNTENFNQDKATHAVGVEGAWSDTFHF